MAYLFDNLVGHKIKSLWLNDEDEELWIEIEDRGGSQYMCYRTANDCCNRVWFCYFNFVGNIYNKKVISTMEFEWQDVPKDEYVGGDYDEAKVLFSITVIGGRLDIEVRNSNNGYYGGSVDFIRKSMELPEGVVRVTERGREPILKESEENIDV